MACSTPEKVRIAYNTLLRDPQGKMELGRNFLALDYNIKMNLNATGFGLCSMDSGWGPERLMRIKMYLKFP